MKKILAITLFCISIMVNGQTYPFKHYTTADGLSQNQVTSMVQDLDGYIWIGTKGGLNRFDGIKFEKFGKENGLLSSNIFRLYINPQGQLVVLTRNGFGVFKNGNFKSYPLPTDKEVCENVFFMGDSVVVQTNVSWERRLYRLYCLKNGQYSQIKTNAQIPLDSLVAICYSPNTGLIMRRQSSKKDLLYNFKNGQITDWPIAEMKNASLKQLWDNTIIGFFNDTIWSMTEHGKKALAPSFRSDVDVYSFKNDPKLYLRYTFDSIVTINNKERKTIKWPYEQTTELLVDDEQTLWVGTEYGVYRLISEAFENFTETDGLNKNIWSVVEDNRKNLWFASFGYGLQKYDGKSFRHIDIGPTKRFDKKAYYMGSRKLSNGSIWFSTHDGILKWEHNRFAEYDFCPQNSATLYVFENPTDHTVLFSTINGLFELKNKKLTRYSNDNGIKGNVLGIALDNDGTYWLAARNLCKLKNGKIEEIGKQQLPFDRITCLEFDAMGHLWLGGADGLFVFDGKSYKPLFDAQNDQPVSFIARMDAQRMMVGRANDILLIDAQQYWGGAKKWMTTLGSPEGFIGTECGQNGILKDCKGDYWIIAANMVTKFNPKKLKKNAIPPRPLIKQIEVLNKNLKWTTIANIDSVTGTEVDLMRAHNNIKIDFTAISSHTPEKITFRYRLKGYQESWSSPTTDRDATYTNLSPGKYTFELMAANSDGVWCINTVRVNIHINPALWETSTFRVIAALALLALVVLLTIYVQKLRFKKRIEKEHLSREYARIQMGSVLKQFDPHFTFNIVSAIGSLIVQGHNEKAYRYLVKLSSLLRAALSDPELLTKPLGKEIDFVRQYCEIQKIRFGERFDYEIVASEGVNMEREIPKMVIQNFVENAMKHGIEPKIVGGKLVIALDSTPDGTQIEIRDNGVGRKAATQNRTYGTKSGNLITHKLFDILNHYNEQKITFTIEDLADQEGQPAGTMVKIFIPNQFSYL